DLVSIPLRMRAIPRWVGVAALLILALALRLLYVWQVHASSLVQPEELAPGFYYNWAQEVASRAWLGNAPFGRRPLCAYLPRLRVILLDRARERAEGQAGMTERGRGAAGAFALAGAVYGLTTLDRDNFILLAPLLAGLALFLGGGWSRRGARAAGAFALGTALVVLPVTARHWAVSPEVALLTTGGGEVFFIRHNADPNGPSFPPPFSR